MEAEQGQKPVKKKTTWKRVKNLFTIKSKEPEDGAQEKTEVEDQVKTEKKKKLHWKRMLGLSKKKKEEEIVEEVEDRKPQFVFPDMEIGSCIINMTWLGVTPKLLKMTLGLEMTQEEINNLYKEVLGSRFILNVTDEDISPQNDETVDAVEPEQDSADNPWNASETNEDAEWTACFD